MRKILLACLALAVAEVTCAQSLEKIQWWTAEDGILTMQVPPHCDYWRVSHYGFTVDDAPFCYAIYGEEFEAKVKVTGDYKTRFDQAGLMLRIDAENYIKAGRKIQPQYCRDSWNQRLEHHSAGWSGSVCVDQGRTAARCRGDILFVRR